MTTAVRASNNGSMSAAVPSPMLACTAPGFAAAQTAAQICRLRGIDIQQVSHQRVGAEAAMPQPDAVLGTEHRREVGVGNRGEGEREHRDARVVRRPHLVLLHARHGGEPIAGEAEQGSLGGRQPIHVGCLQGAARHAERDRSDYIGRARLLPIG